MTDDLVKRLRAKAVRFGGETEAEAKERRQLEREEAADRIEALTAERDDYKRIATYSEDVVLAARAEIDRLIRAAKALGAMPEGYCFCSKNRIGDDSKDHEPECADLRALLAAPAEGQQP